MYTYAFLRFISALSLLWHLEFLREGTDGGRAQEREKKNGQRTQIKPVRLFLVPEAEWRQLTLSVNVNSTPQRFCFFHCHHYCSSIDRQGPRYGYLLWNFIEASPMTDNRPSSNCFRSPFPTHGEPRVWLITAGDSSIGISVARQILAHGDYALLGLAYSGSESDIYPSHSFDAFLAEVDRHSEEGWDRRLKAVPLDIRCGLWSFFQCIHVAPRRVWGS